MRDALTIAASDVRRRLRDRSAIIVGIVAPLVIAGVMSFAFKGTENFHMSVGLVNADHGAVATGFVSLLAQPELEDLITVESMSTDAEARHAVDDGRIDAAYVIPADFSDKVIGGRATSIITLTDVDARIAGEVAASIAASYTEDVNARRLTIAVAEQAGIDASDPAVQTDVLALAPAERAIVRGSSGMPLKGISYYGPAMAIFFLMFSIGFTARSYFTDRRTGMIDRVHAAPVGPFTVVLGKALSVMVFGTSSLAVMGVLTSVFFGAKWGPPPAAIALGLAMVAAVTCVAALVITVARTERQADGWASIITFALALLGGNFTYLPVAPAVMRTLALLTPNGWALRGYTDLSTGAASSSVVLPIAAILAFCAVAGSLSFVFARREMAR